MNRKIIIIEGYLASGKSTFAVRLSKAISVPYFVKDTFKIALSKSVGINTRINSSRFSTVTFDAMMYVTERLLEVGRPVIIEGNFVPTGIKKVDEAGTIRNLLDKYGCKALTYKFKGDTSVLYNRFIEREKTPERGVNAMFHEPSLDDFNKWCHGLDAFDVGGEIIQIDTTDFVKVDFMGYIEAARSFIGR